MQMFQVVSISPTNNAQAVLKTASIELVFDRQVFNVNHSTLYLTRKEQVGNVPVKLTKIAGNIWKITPIYPLRSNGIYTVHATSGIKDIAGNTLEDFKSTFTVQYNTMDPSVLDIYPEGDQESVRVDTCIEAIFSEPVKNVNIDTFKLFKIKDSCIVVPPPPPILTLSGTIIDSSNNQPISGATINFMTVDNEIITTVTSGLAGEYNFTVEPGNYIFEVIGPEGEEGPTYFNHSSSVTITNASLIKNVALNPIPEIIYVLSGKITGGEPDNDGFPLSNATINIKSLSSGNPIIVSSASDINGDYQIILDQGDYIFEVIGPGGLYESFIDNISIVDPDTVKNAFLALIPPPPPQEENDIFLMKEDQSAQWPDYTYDPEDIDFENPIFVPQDYTINNFTYNPGDGSLLVFFNGILKKLGIHYQELNSNTVRVIEEIPFELWGGEGAAISFIKLDLTKAERVDLSPSAGSTVLTLPITYTTGTNGLLVFRNGAFLELGTDYTETSSNTITFNQAFASGDYVTVISGNPYFEDPEVTVIIDPDFPQWPTYEVSVSNYFNLQTNENNAVVFAKGRYILDYYDYWTSESQKIEPNPSGTQIEAGDRFYFYKSGTVFMILSGIKPLALYPTECEIPVPGKITQYSPTNWKFIPDNELDPQSTYLIRLTNGIIDDQGNPIQISESIFTTEFNNKIPEVIERDPFPYSIGVPTDSAITLKFSEPLKVAPDEVITILKNGQPVAKSITFIDSSTIRVTPDNDLDFNTVYTVSIKKGILDDADHSALPEEYTFTTEYSLDNPGIESSNPSDLSESFPILDSEVIIEFNKPVYKVNEESLFLKDVFGNIIESSIIQLEPKIFRIKPKEKLIPQSFYTIEALDTIVDDRKRHLIYNSPIKFYTEYGDFSPEVLNLNPYPGQRDIPLTSSLEITFNKPVSNVNSNTFIVSEKLTGVKVAGTYTESGNTWIFTPNDPFKKNTEYKITLTKEVIDELERSLVKAFVYTIFTEDFIDLSFEGVDFYTTDINQRIKLAEKQGNIPIDAKFLVKFSKPVINIDGNIDFNPGPADVTQLDDTTYLIEPSPLLSNNTDYTITIDKSIGDDRGDILGSDIVLYLTTKIIPEAKIGMSLVNINNSSLLTSGGINSKGIADNKVYDLQGNNWQVSTSVNPVPNVKNAFAIYDPTNNKTFYLGGLDSNNKKTGVWEFDHTNSSFQEVCPSSATPDIIDWAGLIRLYDTSTSSYKYSIIALSFLSLETRVRLFDTTTNTWSPDNDDLNLGLIKITQALGSFIWVEQGNQANDAYMYILGGMSIKNNNLPVKQLQKVRFTLDNDNLKYEVDSVLDKDHIIFNSPLAFQHGLRTDRVGNEPAKRGFFNNPYISSLRCESVYPLASGLFERESQVFINANDLKTHILLPFFINPPDGVIKPLIEVYEISAGSVKYNLPEVDYDYPYLNRSEYGTSPLLQNDYKAEKLVIIGGKDEEGNFLNSTWIIYPNNAQNSTFKFIFKKISPFFTI